MNPQVQFLTVPEDGNPFTFLTGKALDPKEPVAIRIEGVLDSPLRWLEKRVSGIDQKQAHLLVDREALSMTLILEETNHYYGLVSGKLELHPMFVKFGINTPKSLSNFDMAKLFKMNRTAFDVQSVAMQLVTDLQNFRAKVDREIEKSDNNRGDKRELRAQVVESNLPDAFVLTVAIFKGTPKRSFEVEVYVNADDFSCSLVSPVANDLIEVMRDAEIDRVLTAIRELAPDLAIIEQ